MIQRSKLSFYKIWFYKIIKRIDIYNSNNLNISPSSFLCKGSIINATKGPIFLGSNTRIGNYKELNSVENKLLIIKDYSTIYSNCKIIGQVEIERYCTLATNIYMSSGKHYTDAYPGVILKIQDKLVLATKEGRANHSKKIHIHEDVWIGNGVFVASGITIGRGAIIGAGTVVTKNIPPYKVVVGIPGRIIKSRFEFKPPMEIDSRRMDDFPYFYQGFNHYMNPNDISLNGFELIDNGICYLHKNLTEFKIYGYANISTELNIIIEMNTFKFKIEKGEFELEIKKFEPVVDEFLKLQINAIENNQIHVFKIK